MYLLNMHSKNGSHIVQSGTPDTKYTKTTPVGDFEACQVGPPAFN